MYTKKLGRQTMKFLNPPSLISTGTAVGPYEGEVSPFRDDFDQIFDDLLAGQESFEKAERHLMLTACYQALRKIQTPPENVEFLFAGDLMNQLISSGFTALELGIPYLGIYGACSSAAEGLLLAAMTVDGGFAKLVMAATSSHNSTAERQFRYPTEYGVQRKPYSQWTVTGAGAAVVANEGSGPKLTYATVGKVVDQGSTDPLHMGAAMAPAAASTIIQHLKDTGREPSDYDLILTGDLGQYGYELAVKWADESGGVDLSQVCQDCGVLIYDQAERVNSGGSGCGCSAVVTYSRIYQELQQGKLGRVLLVGTGALHSPTSVQQKENLPCIAHAVALESEAVL